MKKTVRWIGYSFLGLLILVFLAATGLYLSTSRRLEKTYSLPTAQIVIPTDADSVIRGQRLVIARCAGCHGGNLAGTVIFQDAMLGTISAANLTAGRGKDGARLQDDDFIRAIRHGVDHTGRPILTMPSEYFYTINDQELGEMIAYLKTSASVENQLPSTHIQPLGIVLIGAGAFGELIAAEKIPHQAARLPVVEAGVTVAYGEYLVRAGQCGTCHGDDLSGGKDPDPNAPPAPDLTRRGELATWDEAGFIQVFRIGKTPAGRPLNQYMPWREIGQMTDDELKAMLLYLQSLPPQSVGN